MPMLRQWGIVVAVGLLPASDSGAAFGFMLADVDDKGVLRSVRVFDREVGANKPPKALMTLEGDKVLLVARCDSAGYVGGEVLNLAGVTADDGLRPGEVEGQPEPPAEETAAK